MKKSILFTVLLGFLFSCSSQDGGDSITQPNLIPVAGDLGVHDPVMIKEDNTYYVFSTGGDIERPGGFIPFRISSDLRQWRDIGTVFEQMPQWALDSIPGTRGIWAPDISFFNGRYHLYYSISTFGQNNSAIGLATNTTLNPAFAGYAWEDQGMVIRSTSGVTDWNAIDPNIAIEGDGKIWMSWGSFWSGIKMRRIDPQTGMLSAEDTTLYSLAERPRTGKHQTPPVVGAIEAPFLFRHGDYWYLFVSFDFCCRGAESTYKIMVGRSRDITGPYVDKSGALMLDGGGSLVLQAAEGARWVGPGHCAVVREGDTDYLVFHAYDGQSERFRSELRISTLLWEDGWPRAASLP